MVTGLFALVLGMAVLAGAAQAQTNSSSSSSVDYSGVCQVSVTPPNPNPGSTATVSGTNFPTGQTFHITFDSSTDLGSVTTGSDGKFSKDVTIPADAGPGSHTISVPCSTTDVEATTTVQVLAVAVTTAPSAPLARTGTDIEPMVLIGLGAVAVGAAFVLTARRRRSQSAA